MPPPQVCLCLAHPCLLVIFELKITTLTSKQPEADAPGFTYKGIQPLKTLLSPLWLSALCYLLSVSRLETTARTQYYQLFLIHSLWET